MSNKKISTASTEIKTIPLAQVSRVVRLSLSMTKGEIREYLPSAFHDELPRTLSFDVIELQIAIRKRVKGGRRG